MRSLVSLAAALVLTGAAGTAAAYPQFTLSQAQTCAACHESPAGGGLLTDMGRFTAEDLASHGGDPELMWGAFELPEWLALGGDMRSALGASFVTADSDVEGSEASIWPLAFPMQVDFYARAQTRGFSANGIVGLRGSRTLAGDPLSFIVSREHYLMWKQEDGANGFYARAGRFMPIVGLRLAEHTFYPRRYGPNGLYTEAYGVSAGWLSGGFEAHVTGFIHDPFRDPQEKGDGAALYAEKRFGTRAAVGVTGRYAQSDDDTRIVGGLTGKLYFDGPGLLLQAEGLVTQQSFDGLDDADRTQLIGQLLATYFVTHGWFLDLGLGHYDEDIAIAGLDRNSVDVNLHYFPWSHLEFVATTRLQVIDFTSGGRSSGYGLLQIHYRL
jgi:hypothetical protein